MQIFEKAYIGNCDLKNRIIRSATFEGMCDENGMPESEYFSLYNELSRNDIGGIITGFAFVSEEGKAIQPGQAGIYSDKFIDAFKKVTAIVHQNGSRIFMQLAHTGRQTMAHETGHEVVGASDKRSGYFKGRPRALQTQEVYRIAEEFGISAFRAKDAGFDGIQIHAAHGYLIHQFLLPSVNKRKDEFGIKSDSRLGTAFLNLVIDRIKERCGTDFPLLIKVSGSDDYRSKFSREQFIHLIKFLDTKTIDAIEVSYGTMDHALNIFRGDVPVNLVLKYNKAFKVESTLMRRFLKTFVFPVYRNKLKPYVPMYNIQYAEFAKEFTSIPIISVGGFRNREEISKAIEDKGIDFVSMSRPFIAEPDLVAKMKQQKDYHSKCINCNYCAIMCDSKYSTKCYKGGMS